ncbi:hypothetical protein CK203_097571 [Vitis vinifera]|uniref:Uncharacterized protein n=1 Tax=Vitis vinifera TaxID=29760 RepID=A0A438CKP4_VITVI|nr:hypothetical protein CK203_097571 [Vitis vinifera]
MGGVSLKGEEEALYAHKGRWNSKQHTVGRTKKNEDKIVGRKNGLWKVMPATSKSEDEWDAQAFFCCTGESAFIATTSEQIDYEKDWIIDLGCSNHMTGDKEKLQDLSEYKGRHMVVTANNSKLPIAHIGHFVLFGPQDMKVYRDLEIMEESVIKGRRLESVYVMFAETAYVDKTRKNETADLWHMRLSHVSYSKLTVMMKKSMLKGLPQLEVRKDTICAGCQYVWVYFMKEKSKTFSKFKEFKEMMEVEDTIVNEKDGDAAILQLEKCYTSRNVVFDESSSWWSSEKEILPDSDVFKDELQSTRIQLSLGEAENATNGDIGDDETQSPWQTGVHGQPSEEGEPSETEAPIPLRRPARTKKPNPKYANVAIVEDANAKEPETFAEAF